MNYAAINASAPEYTVDERAELITKASPPLSLSPKHRAQLTEVLNTLSETMDTPCIDFDTARALWAAVEMVKAGGYSEDMRL